MLRLGDAHVTAGSSTLIDSYLDRIDPPRCVARSRPGSKRNSVDSRVLAPDLEHRQTDGVISPG